MSFSSVSDHLRNLTLNLITRLNSGEFQEEFIAIHDKQRGWYFLLQPKARDQQSTQVSDVTFAETQLQELAKKGYLNLAQRPNGFNCSFTTEAHQEYEAHKNSWVTDLEDVNLVAVFDVLLNIKQKAEVQPDSVVIPIFPTVIKFPLLFPGVSHLFYSAGAEIVGGCASPPLVDQPRYFTA